MTPNGTCFEDAYNLLLDRCEEGKSNADRLRLVHGQIINIPSDGARIAHAWIEDIRGDFVFDITISTGPMRQTSYYAKFSVTRTIKYQRDRAQALNFQSGHYGPWEDWLSE